MSQNRLAPGLLLAAPRVGDPNFAHTVVLLGRHEPEGSMGWVINGRSLGPLRELLAASGMPGGADVPTGPVFDRDARVGGPVAPSNGWLVYRRPHGRLVAGEIDVGPDVGVTPDATVLAGVVRGEEPREFFLLLGYAGWGPEQLDAEVQAGVWLPASVDAALVFETPHDTLWHAAYERTVGIEPGAFTSTRGGSA